MKRSQIGIVISDKMDSSAVVEVSRWKTHRLYGKRFKRASRFLVGNPDNSYKIGDTVEINETRPLSRHKHWQIVKRIEGQSSKHSDTDAVEEISK